MIMHTLDSFLPVYNNAGADVFGVYCYNDYTSQEKSLIKCQTLENRQGHRSLSLLAYTTHGARRKLKLYSGYGGV